MTTVEEIRAKNSTFLTASEIGTLIGIRPDNLLWQARQDPSKLGFPVCVARDTVRIPKWAFLDWLLGSSNTKPA
jgi:hypothetical protein